MNWINTTQVGDNLEIMKTLPSNSIDLIYCDILYGTGRNFGDYQDLKPKRDIIEAFYIPRIQEMHRLLKDTGSIYLQMDTRINHWMRCILDDVFGYGNFRNEISQHYGGRMMHKVSRYNKKHDVILFYSKTGNYAFTLPSEKIDFGKYAKNRHEKIHIDENGRRYLLAPNATMVRTIKQYEDDLIEKGRAIDDVWEFRYIRGNAKERTSYPTQKPKALIERIIKASSNEGDIVADFFCGSGTTAVVANELNRKYFACDLNPRAIEITNKRLVESRNLFSS